MDTYVVKVRRRWFDAIESGLKTVEGRKGSLTFVNVKVGDYFRFVSSDGRTYLTKISNIVPYPSVESYLLTEGLNKTLPGVKTLEEGVAIYNEFWTPEDVEKYGVLAFHLTTDSLHLACQKGNVDQVETLIKKKV